MFKQFDVCWFDLNPTEGAEIRKTRPCVIISPDILNKHLKTVIVAPLTSRGFEYKFRVKTHLDKKEGLIVIDQMCAIDKNRIVKNYGKNGKEGRISESEILELKDKLQEMFA